MKRKLLAWTLTVLMILTLVPMSNANAAQADQITTLHLSLEYGQTEARTILGMINEMRTSSTDAWYWAEDNQTKITCNNLKELQYDYDLEKVAMIRAKEIALSYSHTRPNGESCFTAYDDISWSYVGENIAAGQTSATSVNKSWREDDKSYSGQGHRRSMLDSDFNCVGIGHVYYNGTHYWVEEFAKRSSVTTTKTIANDSKQVVGVDVANSNIKEISVPLDKENYNIKVGDSASVELKANSTVVAKVKNSWPSTQVPITDMPQLSVGDSSIVSYIDGKLTGIKEGSTSLNAKLENYEWTLPNAINVIDKVDVSMCSITLSEDTYTYDGEEKRPNITVTKGSTTLKEGTDYTLTYGDNINAGSAYVEVQGINDYCGTTRKNFTIKPKSIASVSFILGETCNKETQEGQTPSVTMKDGEKVLTEGVDYSATFKPDDLGGYIYYRGLGNYNSGNTMYIKIYSYHQYIFGNIVKYSTCTEHGIKRYYCYNCRKEIRDEELALDPDNHTYDKGEITKKPTCTETGIKTYTCTGCGKTKTQTISATGHKLVKTKAVAATCTTTGNKEYYTCTNDNKIYSDAKGQNETSIEEITLPATGHSWSEWEETKAPNCEEEGESRRTCLNCKEIETKAIPATGHKLVKKEAIEATCTKAGNKEYYTCTNDNKIYSDAKGQNETSIEETTLPATGHNWSEWEETKAPNCEEEGESRRTCRNCGEIETKEVAALGHDLEKIEAKDATYTDSGNKEYYECNICEKLYLDVNGEKETTLKEVTIPVLSKKSQTITGTKSSYTKTYGNAKFSLGAKAKGKLTYKSDKESVATVNQSGVVTIKGAGTAKIKITAAATTEYNSSVKTVTISVKKASPSITIKAADAKKTISYSKVKKKAQSFQLKVSVNSKATLTYKKSSGNSKFTVGKTGKVTVAKGIKKGSYPIQIKVSALAKGNYNAGSKTIKVTVTVK